MQLVRSGQAKQHTCWLALSCVGLLGGAGALAACPAGPLGAGGWGGAGGVTRMLPLPRRGGGGGGGGGAGLLAFWPCVGGRCGPSVVTAGPSWAGNGVGGSGGAMGRLVLSAGARGGLVAAAGGGIYCAPATARILQGSSVAHGYAMHYTALKMGQARTCTVYVMFAGTVDPWMLLPCS